MSKLRITLKSDLCAASGDGFFSIIDTDVAYDRYGFPLIGARRLKGCLREAAQLIGVSDGEIDALFGRSGSSQSGALKLSDAHLAGYQALIREAVGLSAAEIISLFTYTRSATAVENDTVKDGSLRFTRVLRHYSPLDGNETVLEADAELDAAYETVFSDICTALRNIGYKRNRGYGAVKCEYISSYPAPIVMNKPEQVSDEEFSFPYTVMLMDDLMLPGAASNETVDYIPGSSVLGFFAGQYLSANPADSGFEELFLKDNLRFSNLYLSDSNNKPLMTAPAILAKIKGESEAVNLLTIGKDDKRIKKPVKKGYCDFSSQIRLPLTETVYHHSARENDPVLYTQTALSRGQMFSGTISGKREYVESLFRFISDAKKEGIRLHFGRSKTAQYSACEVISVTKPQPVKPSAVTVRKDELFIAVLLSDALIPNEAGGYAVTENALKAALGSDFARLESEPDSALRYRTITGFNTKWNMQKPHIRAIAAGSVLVFRADSDMTLSGQLWIGARKNEGFGNVMIVPADAFHPKKTIDQQAAQPENGKLVSLLNEQRKAESMRQIAIRFVSGNEHLFKDIPAAQIGRYIMMVNQSETLAKLKQLIGLGGTPKKAAIRWFYNLINSAFREYEENDLWRAYLLLILTLIKYRKRGESDNDYSVL